MSGGALARPSVVLPAILALTQVWFSADYSAPISLAWSRSGSLRLDELASRRTLLLKRETEIRSSAGRDRNAPASGRIQDQTGWIVTASHPGSETTVTACALSRVLSILRVDPYHRDLVDELGDRSRTRAAWHLH